MDLEDVVAPPAQVAESPLQDWRLKYQAGTIQITDLIAFIEKESGKYFALQYASKKVRWKYNQAGAKEGIIDVIFAFILGDNPKTVLEKLQQEATTTAVCGKVFKNGEPTYSCRECGMDPTCFLCVSCFQQSAHRYHKYEMSTSGGRGCCDCGDEEAWKKDHYCEEHLRGKENPTSSTIITEAIKKRCEVAFVAILTFCVIYLEIETNANLKYIDSDGSDDTNYCTLLYNDESHTFDQVVQVLTIIGKYHRKDANEIGMDLDREGRVVVKFDSLHECRNLKENIEKQSAMMNAQLAPSRANQSLRVSVLHVNEVSCQLFALQLLKYLQEFLILHCTFREIFTRIIMGKKTKYCIKHILEYDVKLWKTARKLWHRLLMSGILMEYDNKMALAQEFSKHYSTVVQDFIHDDHEHSLAIVSLSVQLFTVPSIAHYLIAYDNIFHKLLHTFYHEAIEKHIKRKTLHFAKNMANMLFFKRAAYILYDLRYILSFKPHVWTDDLREGFLDGCKTLIRLLFVMQGMQLVTRQTGQNVSFMQEWECAFSLHIKLASTISLVLAWCASDSVVLGKMYQTIISALSTNGYIVQFSKTEEKTVAGYVANCIMYDVATQPVSIHLPLSRFFAGIYLHFGAHGFKFDNELSLKRSPENIMEPILCTQTMIAQIHSGMWRLNGHSMLYQLYFYRNVRCRSEMLDRDIVGMQICAALIESNQYLIRILNKFNLINWVQPFYERYLETIPTNDDFIRQLSMIEEFLELLIVIIGERFMPGVSKVTEEDRTKNEIIQLLCIKSYSHSELKRALPDSNNDTSLDDVIDSVAEFKKPQKSDAKGVYELKEELYENYNMYFYHYTKEEKSKSEETQRLRRKNRNELVCCPPPKLPKLTDGFISIANLLQCDVMMTIISTVLDRALDLKAKSFIENHLQEVLYLIGYGLQEEESENYPFLSFYERSQKYKLLYKLEQLSRSARVEAHRDFLLWTVKKFKELQAKESDAMQSDYAESSTTGLADAATVGGDPVIKPMPLDATEPEKQNKMKRERLTAERRTKIIAQMQIAQKSFIKSNVEEQSYKCILCFEDCTLSTHGPTLANLSYLQNSEVLPPELKYHSSVYASSCGHVMHVNCWQEYYNSEKSKELRRPKRNRTQILPDTESADFHCPYCRCLSNSVLPLTLQL